MTIADFKVALGVKVDKQQFNAADRLLGGIKKAIGAIAAYQGVKWLAGVVHGAVQSADAVANLAEKTGMAASQLQGLQFAADMADVSAESLQIGLKMLAKNAYDAANGGKETKAAFKALRTSATDANGVLKPTDVLLSDLADEFAAIPNGPKKAALAIKLFGKSGSDMIPLLNRGSAGIEQLKRKANELGVVLDDKAIAAMTEFDDESKVLGYAISGLKNQFVAAIIPILTEVVKLFQSAAPQIKKVIGEFSSWIGKNRELIGQKIQYYFQQLVIIVEQLYSIFKTIVSVIGSVVNALGGTENAIKVFIGLWAGFKALQLVSYVSDLATSIASMGASAAGAEGKLGGLFKGLGKGLGGVGGIAGKAGLVGLAGAAGYGIGTLADNYFGISDKLNGVENVRDPVHEEYKKKQALAREASRFFNMMNMATGATGPTMTPSGKTITVNSPITVNAANADAREVTKMVGEEVQKAIDKAVRATGNATGAR